MAERRLTGLQRVLGVNALFATAYGNVGSSIYYALGLVAGLALGPDAVRVRHHGRLLLLHRGDVRRGHRDVPRGGGSSSFARRAFNEFVSFFAAWAQMLNYIITVSISAFFVPHYLGGLFWEPLRSAPGDIIFGAAVIGFLSLVNVVGVKESAGLNVFLAVVDFLTQVLLVLVGVVLVLSPDVLTSNVSFGVAPTWTQFLLAIPLGMIAYTGIETISNMAEEAKDETRTIPEAISRVRLAVFAIYFTLPAVALSALPVTRAQAPTASTNALLGLSEEEGGLRRRPDPRCREADRASARCSRPASSTSACLAATLPVHRDQCGDHRRVATRVHDPGIHRQPARPAAPAAPALPHAWIAILSSAASRSSRCCGPGPLPRPDVRVRRDALVHDRARVRDPAGGSSPRSVPAPLPAVRAPSVPRLDLPLFRGRRRHRDRLAFVVTSRCNPVVAARARWLASASSSTRLPPPPGLDLTSTHKVAIRQPVVDHEAEYDSVLVHCADDATTRSDRDRRQARRAQAPRASTCS
jgi:APA family basic amino acid/polyamine antiporter